MNLGCDIVDCTLLVANVHVLLADDRRTEIDQFELGFAFRSWRNAFREEYVLRLEIPVNNIVRMTVKNRPHDLDHKLCTYLLRQHFPFDQVVVELTTLAVLRDQVVIIRVLVCLIHLHHPWMFHFHQDFHLRIELRDGCHL
jgi:hypothetical protein